MNTPKKIAWTAVVIALMALVGYAEYQTLKEPTGLQSDGIKEAGPRSALDRPNSSSTQEYRLKYVSLLGTAATTTKNVRISSCMSDPVVVRAEKGAKLTFTNDDAATHVLFFDPDHQYSLATSSKLTIQADFGSATGAYPFVCGTSTEPAGVILVE